jgi:hypothetical protein
MGDRCLDHRRPDPKAWVGLTVRAVEFVGPDSERRPRVLTGRLEVRYVKALDYDRFSICGVGVDPLSVELIDE